LGNVPEFEWAMIFCARDGSSGEYDGVGAHRRRIDTPHKTNPWN
jgi:hypothetical protein